MTTAALPWFGGKASNHRPVRRWLVDHLAGRGDGCYIEPFAGMLGVLLARRPARAEIVNDLDGRVCNWWRVVRDQPDELGDLLAWTPDRSRDTLAEAIDALDDPDPIRRAWAFTVAVCTSADPELGPHIKLNFAHERRRMLSVRRRLRPLADRIRLVQLENCDAVSLIHRVTEPPPGTTTTLIYADPPYPNRGGGGYRVDVDHGLLDDALLAAAARGIDVACSGYPGDRPALEAAGWSRHECATANQSAVVGGGARPARTECLWTSWHDDPRPALW